MNAGARFSVAAVSAALVGGAFAVQACTRSADDPSNDAGIDATETHKEAGAADGSGGPPACNPDASYLKDIADSSIPDSGTTTGLCFGCAQAKCADVVANCGRDCTCQRLSAGAAECYVKTKQISCAFAFANYPTVSVATRQLALALLGCVQNACMSECAFDATSSDAGDAGDASDGS